MTNYIIFFCFASINIFNNLSAYVNVNKNNTYHVVNSAFLITIEELYEEIQMKRENVIEDVVKLQFSNSPMYYYNCGKYQGYTECLELMYKQENDVYDF